MIVFFKKNTFGHFRVVTPQSTVSSFFLVLSESNLRRFFSPESSFDFDSIVLFFPLPSALNIHKAPLTDKFMKAVDTSTPKVYSRNDPQSPISQAILDLIKEKRRLRRLYNNTQDPNIKSTINNKLQKEIRTKINQESTISWEKFCNSISLESDPKKSWRKITNFFKPKGHRSYPTLKLSNKTAKTKPRNGPTLCRKRRTKLRR